MSTLIAWILTYLLHSTVLLGGAWLLSVALRERRLGVQEAAVRAALVGGFVTATLQLGLGLQPAGGIVALPGDVPAPGPVEARVVVSHLETPAAGEFVAPALKEIRTERAAGGGWGLPSSTIWHPTLAGVWGLLALAAVARLGVAASRLRRMLRPREPLQARDLLARAAALAARLGLRRRVLMSTAPRLEVPLATGVLRPEVCLPTRALRELERDQQVALCAHELAHVARRDPAWILLARLVEAVAPLQPLNIWARRRLQDLAECLADDLAVAASGQPDRLARSLVDVASWTVADAVPFPAAAAGALSSRSRLGHRVERLMDPVRALERPRRFLLPFAVTAVLATALVTPVVSGSVVTEGEPPPPPVVAERPATVVPPAPAQPPAPPAPPAEPAAPPAPPAPPAAPQVPEPPDAAEAPTPPASETEREIEELTRRIEERAETHAAALEEMGAEMERVVEAHMPPPEQMKRLEGEIEEAAETLAEAQVARRQGREAPSQEELKAAREQLRAAQQQLREATRELRIPEGDLKALQEKARELAKAAAPTVEESRRLQELTRELVEESMPDLDELQGEMKQISRTVGRETMEQIRESMRTVRESLRESMPRVREEARVTREAERARTRESRRRSERSAASSERTLEEAEASHLEGSEKSTPER